MAVVGRDSLGGVTSRLEQDVHTGAARLLADTYQTQVENGFRSENNALSRALGLLTPQQDHEFQNPAICADGPWDRNGAFVPARPDRGLRDAAGDAGVIINPHRTDTPSSNMQ